MYIQINIIHVIKVICLYEFDYSKMLRFLLIYINMMVQVNNDNVLEIQKLAKVIYSKQKTINGIYTSKCRLSIKPLHIVCVSLENTLIIR